MEMKEFEMLILIVKFLSYQFKSVFIKGREKGNDKGGKSKNN